MGKKDYERVNLDDGTQSWVRKNDTERRSGWAVFHFGDGTTGRVRILDELPSPPEDSDPWAVANHAYKALEWQRNQDALAELAALQTPGRGESRLTAVLRRLIEMHPEATTATLVNIVRSVGRGGRRYDPEGVIYEVTDDGIGWVNADDKESILTWSSFPSRISKIRKKYKLT